ncbi:hypothetical protein [Altererythrobacter epoxidivorans]|uniref:hypothetical protein n=1 Tax=Altererythrobacter epoxidivorans TaxID=361183 RepID=UPI00078648E3|nr:hypothetical protein [Altererythrobacter epoxidivorans]
MSELLAALVGALLGGGIKIWTDKIDRAKVADTVLVALLSEIKANCDLLRSLGYEEELRGIIASSRANPESLFSFAIDFDSDYMTLYHGIGSEIGRLEPATANKIVRFYANCKTLKDSCRPDGPRKTEYRGSLAVKPMTQSLNLLIDTLKLGDELVQLRRMR